MEEKVSKRSRSFSFEEEKSLKKPRTVDEEYPGRRKTFKYNSPQYLQVRDKLQAWAAESKDFEEGVLVDVNVPLKWWEKTHIRDLPFKIVYHVDSKKIFAIEENGDPLHLCVAHGIPVHIGWWDGNYSVRKYFMLGPSSQNWGTQRKTADMGIDRRVPQPNGTRKRETVCVIECGHAQSLNYLHGRRIAVFGNMDVQVYIFIKVFNSTEGIVQHPAHQSLTLRRMICAQYNRLLDGGVPSYCIIEWVPLNSKARFSTAGTNEKKQNASTRSIDKSISKMDNGGITNFLKSTNSDPQRQS
jgi:hypothetical protein